MEENNPQSLDELRFPPTEGEQLRDEIKQYIEAYKDAAERNALAETPDESADYLIKLIKIRLESVELPKSTDKKTDEEIAQIDYSTVNESVRG